MNAMDEVNAGQAAEDLLHFDAAFEQILQYLQSTKHVVQSLDTVFQLHMTPGFVDFQAFYQHFQYEHMRRLIDALTLNESLASLCFPMEILSENGAVYLGQALDHMESLQELTLVERFFSGDPFIHLVLSQLSPETSKVSRLRIDGRLHVTPQLATFLSDSQSLLLVEANLSLISSEAETVSNLSIGLKNSQSVQDIVFQSPTWERLAVVLACIQHNPRISRLDLCFDMEVGEETDERNNAMIECMRLLGSNRSISTLYFGESTREGFPRHSFYHTALADAIKANSSIKNLQMEGAINQEGISSLSQAFQVNSTIEYLAFPSVRLGSVIPFAHGLGNMMGLKTVLLRGSQMLSREEAEAIANGLSKNSSIWHFQFIYRARNPNLARRIRHYLQLNETGAQKLIADAPIALMPNILAASDRRSLSMLYTFISARGDLMYYT